MKLLSPKNRGAALASTLLIILFLTLFAFTLANLATFDLRTSSRNAQKQMAFEAAQAGLDAVTAELSTDPTLGKADEVFTATLSDGSSYRVTFDDSDTSQPFSANNLDSLTAEPIGYDGRNVPAFHASLFAVGTSPSGETSIVESLIRLEGIPYAVAGSETVTLRNVNVSDPDPGDVAHVYSGRTGADSLNISGLLSVITGDARSAGAINVGGGAIVQGDVEPNISPETLPILNIAGFGNSGWPGQPTGFQPVGIFGSGGHTVPGSVQYGTLTLNDTILFVEGDLDVGLLLGTGTIFVTGETTFLANVNMTGPDRITLFSQGDINFNLATIFQGVVYSRGDIRAAGVFQVLGAVYAVSTPAGGGNIELGGLLLPLSNVIYNAESTAFASFWLAQGGEAEAVRVYWRRLR
jgi:hypothetical protein